MSIILWGALLLILGACIVYGSIRKNQKRRRKASRDIRKEIIAWAMEMEDLGIISSYHYDDLIPEGTRKPPRDEVLLPKILVDQFREIARKMHVIHHDDDPTERILRDMERPED